ncbi:hypothetical protein SAMN05661010_01775 [Modicisalibacter muralis]|uniref:Glycosyl transferase family 2 n=1 Tax=Modicisalibacter muralis TaxID=119000 RepID=A0A1G9KH10_9GAMM|nr:hypothetical protein [Halomonas muralis]SDL48872.1 hypothetical protein SAMN05661010_01775 [Halomonas muralis]
MNSYNVIVDCRRGYTRLGRCLRVIAYAAARLGGSLDAVLIVDKARNRLVTLAEHHGAGLLILPPGPRGKRYNSAANAVQTDVLAFLDPAAELPEDWLLQADQALFDEHWDAVALIVDSQPGPSWLGLWRGRLYQPRYRTQALCIKRAWFERVGGFDPERDMGAERDLLARLGACHARVLQYTQDSPKTAS